MLQSKIRQGLPSEIARPQASPFTGSLVRDESAFSGRGKLLFLSYAFPPAQMIASVRTWNMAKYLRRLGWEITVVTPHPSLWKHVGNAKEIETSLDRDGIRRILTGHRWRCLVPDYLNGWNQNLGWLAGGICRRIAGRLEIDSGIGWVQAAEKACSQLTSRDVDVILASGSPFAAFTLARRLSKKLHRPYVLDYRDPWTGNPDVARPATRLTIRREERLLTNCDAVTIVSNSWGVLMDRRFGLGSRLHVISNGYDPDELAGVKPHVFGHFAIVYAGTFYPPKRVVSPVMAALRRLEQDERAGDTEWYFHYYGGHGKHVMEEAKQCGVTERVIVHGKVERNETLSAIKGAGVAVVITSVVAEGDEEDKGMVTGKIFEAVGLGTPVLLVAPHGSDANTVVETTGLTGSFSGSDIEGMASFLSDAIRGQVPEPKDPQAYAWPNLAKAFDSLLRDVAALQRQGTR